MAIPWYIPHKRHIVDTNEYKNDKDRDSMSRNSDVYPVLTTTEGKSYKIKEFRDEAKRPWWKFFDEFEYRDSTQLTNQRKWYQWFEPGATPQEKKLILKLDFLIAFYSFLAYWNKYLDSANLNNSYVSGMKEDLNMKGNDLIKTQVCFTVGNIIFELPMMYILPRLPINYVLLISEMGWSIFTIFLFSVKNLSQLQALRFFVGAFEAAYYPSIHYVLASWYKPTEISRRGALFFSGQFLGVLTAGLIQGSVYDTLNGYNGMSGWRWCFLIDGIISVAIALVGFLMIPGTPFSCYSIWLTDEEILLARKRMHDNGNDISTSTKSFFNKEDWKKALGTWHVYLLSIIQIQGFNSNSASSGSFLLWLKSLNRYSVSKIDNLGAIPPAVGIFYVYLVSFGADFTHKRFGFTIFSFLMNFIGNVILAIWDVKELAKWVGFMFAYWSWSQSSVFNTLISDFFRRDNNVRAIAWMIQYIIGLQSTAWMSYIQFPTVQSPRFHRGFLMCAGFSMGFVICFSFAYLLYKRDERREALENGIYLYNSEKEEIPDFVRENFHKAYPDKESLEDQIYPEKQLIEDQDIKKSTLSSKENLD